MQEYGGKPNPRRRRRIGGEEERRRKEGRKKGGEERGGGEGRTGFESLSFCELRPNEIDLAVKEGPQDEEQEQEQQNLSGIVIL